MAKTPAVTAAVDFVQEEVGPLKQEEVKEEVEGEVITSPMVGTFYKSSAPGKSSICSRRTKCIFRRNSMYNRSYEINE